MRLPYRRWKALQRVRCLRMNDGNAAGIIRDTKAFLEKYFGLDLTIEEIEQQITDGREEDTAFCSDLLTKNPKLLAESSDPKCTYP